jgi:hypothetical protein
MKNSYLTFYIVVAMIALAYVVGEATGLLFFSMLIMLPVWAWFLTSPDEN